MVSTSPFAFKLSSTCTNYLVTLPSEPIPTGINLRLCAIQIHFSSNVLLLLLLLLLLSYEAPKNGI